MDSDGDGKIAASGVSGRLAERFTTIDDDEDGFITEEEMQNAPRPQRGQRGPRN